MSELDEATVTGDLYPLLDFTFYKYLSKKDRKSAIEKDGFGEYLADLNRDKKVEAGLKTSKENSLEKPNELRQIPYLVVNSLERNNEHYLERVKSSSSTYSIRSAVTDIQEVDNSLDYGKDHNDLNTNNNEDFEIKTIEKLSYKPILNSASLERTTIDKNRETSFKTVNREENYNKSGTSRKSANSLITKQHNDEENDRTENNLNGFKNDIEENSDSKYDKTDTSLSAKRRSSLLYERPESTKKDKTAEEFDERQINNSGNSASIKTNKKLNSSSANIVDQSRNSAHNVDKEDNKDDGSNLNKRTEPNSGGPRSQSFSSRKSSSHLNKSINEIETKNMNEKTKTNSNDSNLDKTIKPNNGDRGRQSVSSRKSSSNLNKSINEIETRIEHEHVNEITKNDLNDSNLVKMEKVHSDSRRPSISGRKSTSSQLSHRNIESVKNTSLKNGDTIDNSDTINKEAQNDDGNLTISATRKLNSSRHSAHSVDKDEKKDEKDGSILDTTTKPNSGGPRRQSVSSRKSSSHLNKSINEIKTENMNEKTKTDYNLDTTKKTSSGGPRRQSISSRKSSSQLNKSSSSQLSQRNMESAKNTSLKSGDIKNIDNSDTINRRDQNYNENLNSSATKKLNSSTASLHSDRNRSADTRKTNSSGTDRTIDQVQQETIIFTVEASNQRLDNFENDTGFNDTTLASSTPLPDDEKHVHQSTFTKNKKSQNLTTELNSSNNKEPNTNDDQDIRPITLSSVFSLVNDLNALRVKPSVCNYDLNFHLISNSVTIPVFTDVSAHSIVLIARSPWFREAYKKFLKHNYDYKYFSVEEDYANRITVKKSQIRSKYSVINLELRTVPPNAFYFFMRFVYVADLKGLNTETAISLFELSDLFKVQSLIDHISEFLFKNLKDYRMNELLQIYSLANKHQNSKLKNKCMEALKKNIKLLVHSKEYKKLIVAVPELAVEIFSSV